MGRRRLGGREQAHSSLQISVRPVYAARCSGVAPPAVVLLFTSAPKKQT